MGTNPSIPLDWDLISRLAQLQCTEDEIAYVCKCSVQTLRNRCIKAQHLILQDFLETNRAGGRASLRRKQMEMALAGDKTLLIWLGKQYLGQMDKHEIAGNPDKPLDINLVGEQLKRKLEKLAA